MIPPAAIGATKLGPRKVIDVPHFGVVVNLRCRGVPGMATMPESPKVLGRPVGKSVAPVRAHGKILRKKLYQPPWPAAL
jgi:hypothetical protein